MIRSARALLAAWKRRREEHADQRAGDRAYRRMFDPASDEYLRGVLDRREVAENATIAALTKRCDELQERFDFVTSAARVTAAQHTIQAMKGENQNLRLEVAALTTVIAGKDTALRALISATVGFEHTADDEDERLERVHVQAHKALALTPASVRERAAAEAKVVEAARVWRGIDVHEGALILGLREGDQGEAHEAWERLLRELRIRVDEMTALAALAAPGQA